MIAGPNQNCQTIDVFRDNWGRVHEAIVPSAKPATVTPVEVKRLVPRVLRKIQRLWPRMELRHLPATRTFEIDTNSNGVPDLRLVTRAVPVNGAVVAVLVAVSTMADPSLPPDRDCRELPYEVEAAAKVATLEGC